MSPSDRLLPTCECSRARRPAPRPESRPPQPAARSSPCPLREIPHPPAICRLTVHRHRRRKHARGRGSRRSMRGPRPLDSTCVLGGVLLSHTLASAVPSALGALASGFGMGPGVNPPAMTTETTKQATHGRRRKPLSNMSHNPARWGSSRDRPAPPVVVRGWWVGREPHSGRKHIRSFHPPATNVVGGRVLFVSAN